MSEDPTADRNDAGTAAQESSGNLLDKASSSASQEPSDLLNGLGLQHGTQPPSLLDGLPTDPEPGPLMETLSEKDEGAPPAANPLEEELYRPAQEEQAQQEAAYRASRDQHEKDLNQWRQNSVANAYAAATDWDSFAKNRDLHLNISDDPEEAKAHIITGLYLDAGTMGGSAGDSDFVRQLRRDQIAASHFGGRGTGSDVAFAAEVGKEAREDKDQRDLVYGPPDKPQGTLMARISEAAIKGEDWHGAFLDWQRSAASDARFRASWLKDYESMAGKMYDGFSGQVEKARPYANSAFQSMLRERDSAHPFGGEDTVRIIRSAPGELRPLIMALLQKQTGEEGAKEKKGGHFWQMAGRGQLSFWTGTGSWLEADTLADAEKKLNSLKPGDTYGGRFDSLLDYVRGKSSNSSEGRMGGWILEPLLTDNVVTEQSLAEAKQKLSDQEDELTLYRQLEQIGNGTLSPLRADSYLGEKVGYPLAHWAGQNLPLMALSAGSGAIARAAFTEVATAETANFAAQQTAKSLLTSRLSGAVYPSAVNALSMLGVMTDQNQQVLRAQYAGMSFTQSYELARNAALAQSAMFFGSDMLTLGMAPGLGRSLRAAQEPVLANFARNLVAHEVGQNFLMGAIDLAVPTIQALSKEAPDVDWHQVFFSPGGWVDQRLDVALMLQPLLVMGAANGTLRARASLPELARIAARTTDDSLMKAAGVTPEGRARLLAEMDPARKLDIFEEERGKAGPEVAGEGRRELDARMADTAEREKEAQAAGIAPVFRVSGGNVEVRDSFTGDLVGTAPDVEGALRIAGGHYESIRNQDADRTAAMASQLQAQLLSTHGDEAGVRRTGYEYSPDLDRTTDTERIQSSSDEVSVMAQMRGDERMNGGDGGMTEIVAGKSVTTFKNRIRETVNKLFKGSTVLDVFHEEAHGFFREALATGRLTRESTIEYIRSLQQTLVGRTTRDGEALHFLPPEGEVSAIQLDEAVSKVMESEILRNRDGGLFRTLPGREGGLRGVPSSLITQNLTATARLAPEATRSFSAFVGAVRRYFGVALHRALAIEKGIRDGKIDRGAHEEFLSKLLGLDESGGERRGIPENAAEIVGKDLEGSAFSTRRRRSALGSSPSGKGAKQSKRNSAQLPPLTDAERATLPVKNANRGVDFSGHPALYPVKKNEKNIVKIQYTGSRKQDYKAANILAGFHAIQAPPSKLYTWHHLDDYDPITNTGTMQLVDKRYHQATYSHNGGVRQYEQASGKKYKS